MKIAIGADSAGKPLLDVIAETSCRQAGLEVSDFSQSGFYADICRKLSASRSLDGSNRPRHPVLRHGHRRLHFRQQGARHPRRADARHLFRGARGEIQQRADHHHGRARDRSGAGQVDRRHLARFGIRSRTGRRPAMWRRSTGSTPPRHDLADESSLLLSYYGDDLTGSTDVMEALSWAASRPCCFSASPMRAAGPLRRLQGGRAGRHKPQRDARVDGQNLPAAFEWLKSLGADVCHYKICSTFDSSPRSATSAGPSRSAVGYSARDAVPLIVGAPQLKRYTAFGNLFAAYWRRDLSYRPPPGDEPASGHADGRGGPAPPPLPPDQSQG